MPPQTLQPHYVRRFGTSPFHSVVLGERLRALREAAGLSQGELARRLGVDAAMTSRWECEASTRFRPVPGHHLPRLAELLNQPLEALVVLGGPQAVPRPQPHTRDAAKDDQDDDDDLVSDLELRPAGAGWTSQPLNMVSASTVSFTTGGVDQALPAPGRPSGSWMVRCWACGEHVAIQGADDYPRCGRCGQVVRAQVRLAARHAAPDPLGS